MKLTLWYVGSISFLVIIFFIYTYLNFSHAMYSSDVIIRFDSELTRYAFSVRDRVASTYGPFYTPVDRYRETFSTWIREDLFLSSTYGQLSDLPDGPGAIPVLVIKNDSLKDRSIPLSQPACQAVMNGDQLIETMQGIFPFPLRVITMPAKDLLGQRYVLQVGMSMKHINTTLKGVLFGFITTWPLVMIIISVMGYLFVRRSLAPVHRLVSETRTITAEDLSRRITPDDSADEIGELTTTLNAMIERIEDSFNSVRQFSGDAAHELRTPVTAMRGEIEVALRSERTGEEYRELLESLLDETVKLSSIIDDLLLLSRLDTGKHSFSFKESSLDEIVMLAYEDMLPLAEKKGISLRIDSLAEITVHCEAGLLRRLFVNLIHNAVKYTPGGGSIGISLAAQEDKKYPAVFTIRDSGIGIPRKNLPHIFDRFYRVDPSRASRSGGRGLGLTIVKRILDLHRGEIKVESSPGEGTVFHVKIPEN